MICRTCPRHLHNIAAPTRHPINNNWHGRPAHAHSERHRRPARVALLLLALILPTLRAAAQEPKPIEVTITGVQGLAQVRDNPEGKWRKAQVGMIVAQGAEFRTATNSAVRLLVPPDQTITLDRLGVIKLLEVLQDKKLITTKVGMPYGRTRYDIEMADVEHRSEIVTPSSTLAIRGTRVSVYDQPPFAPAAASLTGRAIYSTAKRQIAFGAKGQGKTDVSSKSASAAESSVGKTYVDPASSSARSESDQKAITQLQAKGDKLTGNSQSASAYSGPTQDAKLMDLLSSQGRFNIALRWFGKGEFDMFVLAKDAGGNYYTLGKPNYPGSVFNDVGLLPTRAGGAPVTAATSADGGKATFDQTPFGKGGLEYASWGKSGAAVPQQEYTVAIVYYDRNKTPTRGAFRVDAYLDGKRVPVLLNFDQVITGTADKLRFGQTYNGTASLNESDKVLPIDPASPVKGDVRITTINITPNAQGLDGKPIGQINTVSTSAAKRSAKTSKGR